MPAIEYDCKAHWQAIDYLMEANTYRQLDPTKINETLGQLAKRIEERFPQSGLSGVCRQLVDVGAKAAQRAEWISRPNLWIRSAIAILAIILVAGLASVIKGQSLTLGKIGFAELIQVCEAGTNLIVLLGAGIFFLVTLETRIKRGRALKAIHELRVLAHIIDMHQLTKDPEWILTSGQETASSPKRRMSSFELSRYLDYCSEMLSLCGNIAALYVQSFEDPVAIASVNEVEVLTTGISRKVWQKLMIIHNLSHSRAEPEPAMDANQEDEPNEEPTTV